MDGHTLSHHKKSEQQSGQIALIVLLIMTVGLTLGVSLSSRTVMDTTLSRQEQEGTRTFQAAESGIEEALSQDFAALSDETIGDLTVGLSNVDWKIAKQYIVQTQVNAGGVAQVNLEGATGLDAGEELKISWTDAGCNGTPSQSSAAVLIRVSSGTNVGGIYTGASARNFAYSACDYANSFSSSAVTDDGDWKYVTVPLTATDLRVSIHPLYNSTTIKAEPVSGFSLPVQGYDISSSAKNTQGNETKAIVVNRSALVTPSVLDFVLYSGGQLAK